ncbi:MAG: AMP-binding protein [Bacteroidales bacterium]|nr:AMP-binding protein [Bacteroidales bacterium]MBR0499481.1 AMP-binding protein [Bacteroidales bacterium]
MAKKPSRKRSLNVLFEESFKKNWDRPALSNYNQKTLYYKDVARKIAELHLFFENCGLKKGDKIAVCSRNQVNWAVAYLAGMTYGAVVVPILHEFQPANLRHLVSHSEARVFFVGDNIWSNMSEMDLPGMEVVVTLTDFKVVRSINPSAASFLEEIDSHMEKRYPAGFRKDDIRYHVDAPEELALISYTSGTSGFSKGVMIPYRALLSNVQFACEAEPHMDCNSRMVSMLPTAHMYGMVFEFLFEMTIGAHVFFLTRLPSPKIILEAMGAVKPDTIISVPLVIEKIYKNMLLPFISKKRIKMMLNLPVLDKMVKNKIRDSLIQAFGGKFGEVIIGGAPFNREAEAFFKRINFPFTIGYGMTECAPIITYVHWDKTKLYSCGKAAPRMKIKIDSDDPKKIPGEVLVKGDNVFLGYYKNEIATRDAFADGWFRTGDMGIIDGDGYLYLKGRCKSMILGPSGQNIYPEEIESILNNMPYVVESLVIEDDYKLVGLIYPDFEQAQEDGLDRDQLLARLKEGVQLANLELDQYCKISGVEIVDQEFEKTPKRSIKRYLYQREVNVQ